MNKVSVVILNWNGAKYLEKFLPDIIKYSAMPGVEIIIADNCSSDNSIDFIKTNFPQIKLILFDRNYGFAEGYNKAVKQINSEYYVFLNNDVEVSENWLLPVIEYMDAHTDVGASMPKLRGYIDKERFEYAGAAGGFLDKYGYPFCRGRVFDTVEKDSGQYDNTCEIFWATGACMYVRAEVFSKVGGFDKEFFAHMEEIDLCWRMKWFGYKIMYLPQVTVFHVGGGVLSQDNPRKTFLNFRNNLFLLFKNLPSGHLCKLLIIRLMLDSVAALKYIVNFRLIFFYAIIRAHTNFWYKLPYLISYRKSAYFLNNKNAEFPSLVNKSIIVGYFVKKKLTYNEIIN